MRAFHTLLLLLALSAPALAEPPPPAPPPPPPRLNGTTLDGQAFGLEALRGRVVMLFFWNTDCVPCIQTMPELRANAAGWRDKPFTLVLVSTDRQREAAQGYLRTLRQIDKGGPAMPMLWAGEQRFGGGLAAPPAVPVTLVLDTEGRVASRHVGRVAPEAWDEVAGLLP